MRSVLMCMREVWFWNVKLGIYIELGLRRNVTTIVIHHAPNPADG